MSLSTHLHFGANMCADCGNGWAITGEEHHPATHWTCAHPSPTCRTALCGARAIATLGKPWSQRTPSRSQVPSPVKFWPPSNQACVPAKSLQSCLTHCNPKACSPPDSSVRGILQARVLEWVAMPDSTGSSQPRDRTRLSYVFCTGR